jgi:hypothetical protein
MRPVAPLNQRLAAAFKSSKACDGQHSPPYPRSLLPCSALITISRRQALMPTDDHSIVSVQGSAP